MALAWTALNALFSIVGFITFIIVLVKLFRNEGILKGILGLICGIYTFIWGWIKHRELSMTKVMAVWTLTLVASIAISSMVATSGFLSMFSMFRSASDVIKTSPVLTEKISKMPRPEALSKMVRANLKPVEKPVPRPSIHSTFEMKKLNAFINQYPTNADAFYNRALVYHENGNLLLAEKDYTKAIELDDGNEDAYYNRGLVLAETKNYDRAVWDFDKVLELNPDNFEAYCNRGNVNYHLGNKDLAIEDYTTALRINPDDADLHYNRAVVYQDNGQLADATSDFEKAASLGHPKAKAHLLGQDTKVGPDTTASIKPSAMWKEDLTNVTIPSGAAKGMIRGDQFVATAAKLDNGILTLRDGDDFFPDHAVTIFLFLEEGETVEGKSYEISKDSGFGSPHVHLKWKPSNSNAIKTKIFMKDYSMRLEFESITNGKIPGRIYLCLPDEMNSVVAGTFKAIAN